MISKLKLKFKNIFGLDFNYFIANSSWMIADNIISGASLFLISVVFSRIASKEVYGQYSLLMSLLAMVSVLAMTGATTAAFRSMSTGFDGTFKKTFNFMLKWSTLAVPLLFALGMYFYSNGSKNVAYSLMILATVIPFYYPLQAWSIIPQAKQMFKLYFRYNLMLSLSRLIVVILTIIIFNGSLVPVFFSFVVVTIIGSLIFHFKSIALLTNDKVDKDWKRTSYRMFLPSLFNQLYDHLDKLILVAFLGTEKLAIYAIAVSVISVIRSFSSNILRAYLSKIYKFEYYKLLSLVKKSVGIILLISIIGLSLFALILPVLITFFFTDKYADSIFIAQIYLSVVPFYFLTILSSTILIKLKKENVYTFSLISSGVINVALYVILIPWLGIIGAVISSVIFYIVQSGINWGYILWGRHRKDIE